MFEGWPLNLFGWRELQKKVSRETGIPLGSLIVLSTSAHIYDTKWEEAKKILTKYHNPSEYRFDVDPRGNFVILLDYSAQKITLQHFTPVGERTQFVIDNVEKDEKRALEELFTKLVHSNLVSRADHAFYLGAELQKAFEAMKSKKEYKQDKPL
jgi:thymidylate synthase